MLTRSSGFEKLGILFIRGVVTLSSVCMGDEWKVDPDDCKGHPGPPMLPPLSHTRTEELFICDNQSACLI
jgi:hypothetical protein